MTSKYIILIFIAAIFFFDVSGSHAKSTEEANLKDALNNMQKIMREGSDLFCVNHEKMSGFLLVAISNLDAISTKSTNPQEAQNAKKFRAELIDLKSEHDKKYQDHCAKILKEFLENHATREQYIKEYNENIHQANRFRERALQNSNRHEACQSLYSEKTYLEKAKTSLAVLSGRFEKTAQDEAKERRNLNDRLNQNQVDGKYNSCW
jgi:hypothetical protein